MSDADVTLVLVRDLMFSSKIGATARALNIPFKIVRDPAVLGEQPGRTLIVDLNQDDAIAAAGAWGKAVGRPVVGFVSHTDVETIAAARQAGIGRVMARSQFVQVLPELLGPPPPAA